MSKASSGYYEMEMKVLSSMQDWLGVQESILNYTIARCREFVLPWKKKEWFEKVKRCHKGWQEGRRFAREQRQLDRLLYGQT